VTLLVDSRRPEDVFTLIARIEHMPELMTNVRSVTVAGPERMQIERQVGATSVVEAIALVGSEAGA